MRYPTDSSLVEACCQGDRAAWETLVSRYSRLVWSVPRRYGLAPDDCEDVHQTVFAALIRSLEDVRDRERISSWLITTATRECWRLRRMAQVRAGIGSTAAMNAPGAVDALEAPAEQSDHVLEERQLVREALLRIDERCRNLLTALFSGTGEPRYPEIAQRLGIPIGSIGPTRARCLGKLETLLREAGVAEAPS